MYDMELTCLPTNQPTNYLDHLLKYERYVRNETLVPVKNN